MRLSFDCVLSVVITQRCNTDISSWQWAMPFLQVHNEFKALAPVSLSSYCIYGVAAYEPQESDLQSGIHILVDTPGSCDPRQS